MCGESYCFRTIACSSLHGTLIWASFRSRISFSLDVGCLIPSFTFCLSWCAGFFTALSVYFFLFLFFILFEDNQYQTDWKNMEVLNWVENSFVIKKQLPIFLIKTTKFPLSGVLARLCLHNKQHETSRHVPFRNTDNPAVFPALRMFMVSLSLCLSVFLSLSLFGLSFSLWEWWIKHVVLCHLMIQGDSDQCCPGLLNNFQLSRVQILNSEISFNSIIWDFISAVTQSCDFISCCAFLGSNLLLCFCCPLWWPLYRYLWGTLGWCARSLTNTLEVLALMLPVVLCLVVCSDCGSKVGVTGAWRTCWLHLCAA